MRSCHSTIQLSTKTFGERDAKYVTAGDRRALDATATRTVVGAERPPMTIEEAFAAGRNAERADVALALRLDANERCVRNEGVIRETLDMIADAVESGDFEGTVEQEVKARAEYDARQERERQTRLAKVSDAKAGGT